MSTRWKRSLALAIGCIIIFFSGGIFSGRIYIAYTIAGLVITFLLFLNLRVWKD